MNTLPRRFSRFVTPTVRRVYLDTSALERQDTQMKALEDRLRTLERDVTRQRDDARRWQAVARTHELTGARLRDALDSEKAARERLADEAAGLRTARVQAERRLTAEKTACENACVVLAEECRRSTAWEDRCKRALAAKDRLEQEVEDERRAHTESCEQWRLHCDRIEKYYQAKAPVIPAHTSPTSKRYANSTYSSPQPSIDLSSFSAEHTKRIPEFLLEDLDASDYDLSSRGRTALRDNVEADLSFSPDRSSSPASDLRRSLATELSSVRRSANAAKKANPDDKENTSQDLESPSGRTIRPLPRRAVVKREREDETGDAELRKRTRLGASQATSYAERLGAKFDAALSASASSPPTPSLKTSTGSNTTASFRVVPGPLSSDKRVLNKSLGKVASCDDPECDDCTITAMFSVRCKA
jgi:hypothetical protein